LNLEDHAREIRDRSHARLRQDRRCFLVRRCEDQTFIRRGSEAKELGTELGGTSQPDLFRLEQRHRDFQRPDPFHLAAEDALDPTQHSMAEWKQGLKAARERKGESSRGEESVRAVRRAERRKHQLGESHRTFRIRPEFVTGRRSVADLSRIRSAVEWERRSLSAPATGLRFDLFESPK
jgi:hypothetical protein